jgi:hypothetical protein
MKLGSLGNQGSSRRAIAGSLARGRLAGSGPGWTTVTLPCQPDPMALTPADKQRRYRERQSALRQGEPAVMERALLQEAERAERGELSAAKCFALADKLADLANRHLWRSHKLAETARKIRPPGLPPAGPL